MGHLRATLEANPLTRLQKYLLHQKLLSQKHLKALEADIQGAIDRAWQEAQEQMASMGDSLQMFDHVYAEPSPYLEAQRQAWQQFRTAHEEAAHA